MYAQNAPTPTLLAVPTYAVRAAFAITFADGMPAAEDR
jgi:hypothetical protein